jgi:DNA-binding PadR family transcriptional regulator
VETPSIIAALHERSDGEFDMPEGTVYPALHKLEAAGLVASAWSTEGGRKRRIYSLTANGRAALAEQKREWRRFARGVESVVWA